MSFLLRLVGCVCLLGVVVVAVCVARPAVLEEFGLDVWAWPNAAETLDAEEHREQGLDQRMEGALHRYEERSRISRELIAGRISLDEAVRLTEALGGSPENYRWLLLRNVPGATHEERVYRHVIAWACDLLEGQPDRAASLRGRLLAEVAARFRQPPAAARQ